MASGGAGNGDKLARGAQRANYAATEKPVTDEKWEDAFKDFDPAKFQEEGMPKPEGGEKERSK